MTHGHLGESFLATYRYLLGRVTDDATNTTAAANAVATNTTAAANSVAAETTAAEEQGVIVFSLAGTESRTIIRRRAREAVATLLKHHSGALILTDLRGSTPANIAAEIAADTPGVACVGGLNLGMLLEAMDCRNLPLPELCKKSIAAAKKSAQQIAVNTAANTNAASPSNNQRDKKSARKVAANFAANTRDTSVNPPSSLASKKRRDKKLPPSNTTDGATND